MAPSAEVVSVPAIDIRIDSKGSSRAPTIVDPFPVVKSDTREKDLAVSIDDLKPVTREKFKLEDHPIDITNPLRVAVIGAGVAGINAGILLPVKVPGIKLKIFDKNFEPGGTWVENIYPGVRCDIPAHVYQSTFSPNTQWSEEYAQGAEIKAYWKSVAQKYNVNKYLNLGHKVIKAKWSDSDAQWTLSVENLQTGEQYNESFDVVISAVGRFNAWKLPDYPGIKDYKGHLRHSSNWDPEFDPSGKTVAVIGNGAGGIQIVPRLQKVVKHLDHYARSKTWIAGSFGGEDQKPDPVYFSGEQLKSFEYPETYYEFRKRIETGFYRRFGTVIKGSEANKQLKEEFQKIMEQRLIDRPDILSQILPDFAPSCRRLTPGPGYLEALTQENVSFITTPITRFTETGIVTEDGTERNVDAVICSTGANVDMIPQFPIIARGIDLRDAWSEDGLFGYPHTYLGLATPGFPNLLFVQGPNGAGQSGTLCNSVETQVTYLAKLLRKATNQNIRTFEPSRAAADDFAEYCDAFFPTTAFTDNCSSWANGGKPGGKITGHWPGSASHLNHVRRDPRWEDWEWTNRTKSGNRFGFFGNGWTKKELDENSDLTTYLRKPNDIDLRIYHEEWFDL